MEKPAYSVRVNLSDVQRKRLEKKAISIGLNVPNYCKMVLFTHLNNKSND